MTLPVEVHPRVEKFLDDNVKWWSKNRSPEQAERWYDGLIQALIDLGGNAESRPLATENDAFPFEVRELYYGLGNRPTHRALFTIRPDKVYVFEIRHCSQDTLQPDALD